MPTLQAHVFDIFQQYSRLYEMRNRSGGRLSPEYQKEWIEVTFTLESIFSGLYRPEAHAKDTTTVAAQSLRNKIPVDYLRVPTDADVLCETHDNFFSGKLQDISVGGAYVQTPIPFRPDSTVRLTFCTFRDREPLEIEARIAWNNPGSIRKQSFPEGAGVQFKAADGRTQAMLREYVYELVEETLTRANLI